MRRKVGTGALYGREIIELVPETQEDHDELLTLFDAGIIDTTDYMHGEKYEPSEREVDPLEVERLIKKYGLKLDPLTVEHLALKFDRQTVERLARQYGVKLDAKT